MDLTSCYVLCTAVSVLVAVSVTFADADEYCSLSQFGCMNGYCIPNHWQCDEEDDCKDNSDEMDCAPRICNLNDDFKCKSGQCIPARWQCDGEPDCSDASDEADSHCSNIECRSDYFSCGVAKPCIPMNWKCDGHEDCISGLDESPETCGAGSCKTDEFLCVSSKRCITSRWVCDLDKDCEDGSDENNCELTNCTSSQWQCDNRQCLPTFWRCDGDTDCHDASDERNCTSIQPRADSGKHCASSEFQCTTNGDCVHSAWRCDGDDDCMDSSDELGCKPRTCKADEFQCVGAGHCISESNRCNGVRDCDDGSDENGCTDKSCDPQTMFDCTGGRREHCISLSLVCNHYNDCLGMDDEQPELCLNTTDSCTINNGGCAHECRFTYVTHICTCPQGYQLASDGRNCEDVDECKIPGTCTQLCENKKGGYKCSCRPGYDWDQGDQSCRALGDEPFLLFANRHDLREIRLYSGNYHMLVDGLKSVIALDFDFAEKLLFWSDVATETISMTRLVGNKSQSVNVLVEHDVSTPDGLAFDWIHKNLYWTDTGNNRIDVLALSMTGGKATGDRAMRKTLFNVNLDEPRAIVVDPRDDQRFLYWTDWGNNPKIERSFLDGTARRELITDNLQWPNGLTIDYESNLLFWVDAKLHHIACSDLMGDNQRIVMMSYQHLKHPFAIAVFEDHVYWTDWETESIFKVHKFADKKGRSAVKNVAMQLYTPMDIHIYHKLKQPQASNACKNHDCSHICLPRAGPLGDYSCLCPDHDSTRYNLDERRKKCIPIVENNVVTDGILMSSTVAMSSRQYRQHQPSAGHIAGVVVAILLIIAIIMMVVGVIAYKCFVRRTVRTLNFDNPVYRKTTEDHLSLEKHQYQPSRSLPSTMEPLTSADSSRECV